MVQGSKKSVGRKPQQDRRFSGDGITMVYLAFKAGFGDKSSARALQDDVAAMAPSAYESGLSGNDQVDISNRISYSKEYVARRRLNTGRNAAQHLGQKYRSWLYGNHFIPGNSMAVGNHMI